MEGAEDEAGSAVTFEPHLVPRAISPKTLASQREPFAPRLPAHAPGHPHRGLGDAAREGQ